MIISEWKLKDLLQVPLSWELSKSCVSTFAARRKSISTFKLRIRILWVCWCGGAWTLSKCYYMTYYRVQWERRVGSDSNMTWRRSTQFNTVSVTQLEMVTQCCPYITMQWQKQGAVCVLHWIYERHFAGWLQMATRRRNRTPIMLLLMK